MWRQYHWGVEDGWEKKKEGITLGHNIVDNGSYCKKLYVIPKYGDLVAEIFHILRC